MLARELITRENNIIERIIGQESETPLSAGPTGPLITSLFHVNVLHDINYLGGWPIGRIQREPLFLPPSLPLFLPSSSSFFPPFFRFNFTPRSFIQRALIPLPPIEDEALTEIFTGPEKIFFHRVFYYARN